MPAKTEQPALPTWSVTVSVADIPEAGLHREIEADAAARSLVAAIADVRDVSRLVARFDITPMAGGRIHVGGHVSAVVGQNCVVTLEPLDSAIEEDIDVTYALRADTALAGSREFVVDPQASDPPEPLPGNAIDLGALATEFLILGINPYPRKPDAVFEPPAVAEDAEEHPFAALKALKDKPLKS
jgi:hypothetical protein